MWIILHLRKKTFVWRWRAIHIQVGEEKAKQRMLFQPAPRINHRGIFWGLPKQRKGGALYTFSKTSSLRSHTTYEDTDLFMDKTINLS